MSSNAARRNLVADAAQIGIVDKSSQELSLQLKEPDASALRHDKAMKQQMRHMRQCDYPHAACDTNNE